MRFRFMHVLALLAVVAGTYAGVARALDFDEEDPHPPRAEIGLVYHYEIGTHAGCLPHHLVISSGALPPGLKLSQLNDHTGLVDGVATESGTWSVWLAVKDCENKSAETLFTFEVWARRFAIATESLQAAAVGSPYSAKLETSGIPSNTTWEVTGGSLPAGLTLSKEGAISGTPTAPGSSTFTVKATGNAKDFSGIRVDSRQLTINVTQATAVKLSRRTAEVGIPFRSSFVATGGQSPYIWSATSPAWLQVAPDGSLSGVPQKAGLYNVTAHLVDANGVKTDLQVALVVRPRLALAAQSLPAASPGHAYRAEIEFSGGVGGLRWTSEGALPGGLKLSAKTGVISGTPRSAGTFRIRVRVRDALGAVSARTFVLSVR
jgi:hypothetical protein